MHRNFMHVILLFASARNCAADSLRFTVRFNGVQSTSLYASCSRGRQRMRLLPLPGPFILHLPPSLSFSTPTVPTAVIVGTLPPLNSVLVGYVAESWPRREAAAMG